MMQFLHRCRNSTVFEGLGQALHVGVTGLKAMVVFDHDKGGTGVVCQDLLAVRQRHDHVV